MNDKWDLAQGDNKATRAEALEVGAKAIEKAAEAKTGSEREVYREAAEDLRDLKPSTNKELRKSFSEKSKIDTALEDFSFTAEGEPLI